MVLRPLAETVYEHDARARAQGGHRSCLGGLKVPGNFGFPATARILAQDGIGMVKTADILTLCQ